MKPARSLLELAFLLSLLFASPADAANYAFVSSTGDNANPCTRTQPCRSLQAAVDAVNASGQIQVLDAGTYGFVSITKSLTIVADGVTAYVRAVTIENAGARIVLRGLFIANEDAVASGINIVNAKEVLVENCTIEGYASNGIRSGGPDTLLSIKGSISRMNGVDGLRIDASGASAAMIDGSLFADNGDDGIDVGATEITITNSVLSGNGNHGFVLAGGRANVTHTTAANNTGSGFRAEGAARITIESSVSRGNISTGLRVVDTAIGRISHSTFTNNGVGVSNGATLQTRENNIIDGNDDDLGGMPLTPIDELQP